MDNLPLAEYGVAIAAIFILSTVLWYVVRAFISYIKERDTKFLSSIDVKDQKFIEHLHEKDNKMNDLIVTYFQEEKVLKQQLIQSNDTLTKAIERLLSKL